MTAPLPAASIEINRTFAAPRDNVFRAHLVRGFHPRLLTLDAFGVPMPTRLLTGGAGSRGGYSKDDVRAARRVLHLRIGASLPPATCGASRSRAPSSHVASQVPSLKGAHREWPGSSQRYR